MSLAETGPAVEPLFSSQIYSVEAPDRVSVLAYAQLQACSSSLVVAHALPRLDRALLRLAHD